MCTFLSYDTRRARKQHACSWCGQKIEAGDSYDNQAVIFEGEMCVNKFHPECGEAAQEAGREEGGCFEFMPGENERPQIPSPDPNDMPHVQGEAHE
jgi:hypothetical protein